MSVDVLYLTWNRRDMTRVSLATLLAHTTWALVDRLVVYDDGSTDGTREWLEAELLRVPVEVNFRPVRHRSPVQTMYHYLLRPHADIVAKIDSDIAVPQGWLERMLASFTDDVDALGMAAGWTGHTEVEPGWQRASHIGGVGLIRTASVNLDELDSDGRYGWTEYQHAHEDFVSAWVTPDVSAVQLDLIPDPPWPDLTAGYVADGWARRWPPYDPSSRSWWSWIPTPEEVR